VKRMEAADVPTRITASTRASEWTGLSGSIGMIRAARSRTGLEARAAATRPVAITAKSKPWGLGVALGAVRSNTPRRKTAPAIRPARIPVA